MQMENDYVFVHYALNTWAKILDWFYTFCEHTSYRLEVANPIVTHSNRYPTALQQILDKISDEQGFFHTGVIGTNWRFKHSVYLQRNDQEIYIDILIRYNDSDGKHFDESRHPAYIVVSGIQNITGIEPYNKTHWTPQDLPSWNFNNETDFDVLLHRTWNNFLGDQDDCELCYLWRLSQPANGKPQIWWPVGDCNKAIKQFMQLWAAVLHTDPPDWALDVGLPYTFPVQIEALTTWQTVLNLMKKWFERLENKNVFELNVCLPSGNIQQFELPIILDQNIFFQHDWKFKQKIEIVKKHEEPHLTQRIIFSFLMKNTTVDNALYSACIVINEVQMQPFPWCIGLHLHNHIPSDFTKFQQTLITGWTVPETFYNNLKPEAIEKVKNLWRLIQPNAEFQPTVFWPVGGDNLAVKQFIALLSLVFQRQTPEWAPIHNLPTQGMTAEFIHKQLHTLHARLLLLENKQLNL